MSQTPLYNFSKSRVWSGSGIATIPARPSVPGIFTPYDDASFSSKKLETVASTSAVDTFSPLHLKETRALGIYLICSLNLESSPKRVARTVFEVQPPKFIHNQYVSRAEIEVSFPEHILQNFLFGCHRVLVSLEIFNRVSTDNFPNKLPRLPGLTSYAEAFRVSYWLSNRLINPSV